MALKFNPSVTIYSNGPTNTSGDAALQKALDTAIAAGMRLDTRRVAKLINDGEKGISLKFEAGDNVELGMLLHKPATRAVGQRFIEQLGLEVAASTGEVKVDPLFTEASVPGVFVPGDAGQLLKQVAVAMGTGTLWLARVR
jgi:thioredoxin reductase